jgi:hypothetical protein
MQQPSIFHASPELQVISGNGAGIESGNRHSLGDH